MKSDKITGYWEGTIKSSSKFMYYFWMGFAWFEFYNFIVPVLNHSPRGLPWYLSIIVLIYSVEFLYQWGIHREPDEKT